MKPLRSRFVPAAQGKTPPSLRGGVARFGLCSAPLTGAAPLACDRTEFAEHRTPT